MTVGEAMSGDVVARAKAVLEAREKNPGLYQRQQFAEWLSAGGLDELVAEVERLRGDRYDWMADELVVIADEMVSGDDGGVLQRKLIGSVVAAVAEFAARKGGGRVEALPAIRRYSGLSDA